MAKVPTSGTTVPCTMATGSKTKSTAQVSMSGPMVAATRVNGKITICTVVVNTPGKTAGNTLETT